MKSWLKKNRINLILIGIVLLGLGLIAYPGFADWWNSFHQSRAVASYAESVANLDASKYSEMLAGAEAYNADLAKTGVRWIMTDEQMAEYNRQLAVTDSGIMGYIDIPKIRVTLPIYHGTDDTILQIAIGHIAGTSLPVGGASTHCVVSGHRGLPSARLFTDIDKLVEGDTFTMTVLNRTVTYEVDQIRIVEPTDLSNLQIEEGKDYCTLVTCTPYGINTHRLLVRGHRVANANGEANVIADALQIEPVYVAPAVAAPMLIILLILLFVMTSEPFRKKGRKE
jgi:sortase A